MHLTFEFFRDTWLVFFVISIVIFIIVALILIFLRTRYVIIKQTIITLTKSKLQLTPLIEELLRGKKLVLFSKNMKLDKFIFLMFVYNIIIRGATRSQS